MPGSDERDDVHITQDLRQALHEYADVTFTISTEAAEDRILPALREIWRNLWDVGLTAASAPEDAETPSYVSDPISTAPASWKLTVDFAHVSRQERVRSPELVAVILRRHAAVPAILDSAHLTKEEYEGYKEVPDVDTEPGQPRFFRL